MRWLGPFRTSEQLAYSRSTASGECFELVLQIFQRISNTVNVHHAFVVLVLVCTFVCRVPLSPHLMSLTDSEAGEAHALTRRFNSQRGLWIPKRYCMFMCLFVCRFHVQPPLFSLSSFSLCFAPGGQPKHDSHSDAIRQFEGDFECLSNTYKCPVSLRGDPESYPSVEVS